MAINFGFYRRIPWVTASGKQYGDVRFAFVEGPRPNVGDLGVFDPKQSEVSWMKGDVAPCYGYPAGEQGKVDLLIRHLEAEDKLEREKIKADVYEALAFISDETPARVVDVQADENGAAFIVIERLGWVEYELIEAGAHKSKDIA